MQRGFYIILFFVLIAGNISAYRAIFAPRVLEVIVLEVGNGNAMLVRSPNGETILVDTGPDASILRALGENLPVWQRKIDVVILTGSAARFAGGLPAVQSRYHVSEIIRIGDAAIPYGSSFVFDSSYIKILAPSTIKISYGTSVFNISSSTPSGTYTSNEQPVKSPRLF